MLVSNFSNLQVIHTASTNLADMLSEEHFSTITNKMCQLQHETLPPQVEFIQLKPNKHYLVKHVDVSPTQKR